MERCTFCGLYSESPITEVEGYRVPQNHYKCAAEIKTAETDEDEELVEDVELSSEEGTDREVIQEHIHYFYQMNNLPGEGDPLADRWLCCGAVKSDGSPAEIRNYIDFYFQYYSIRDIRFISQTTDCDFKVVIVKGFFGNVPGREHNGIFMRNLVESDFIETFNFAKS